MSATKVRMTAQSKTRFASKKADEHFGRLNVNSFVTLVLQSAKVTLEEKLILQAIQDAKAEGDETPVDATEVIEDPVERALQSKGITAPDWSKLQSVIVGVGEVDINNDIRQQESQRMVSTTRQVDTTRPYLLLDVRTDDEYKKGRIITAFNYPAPMIARMQNYESRELSAYKNLPGKLIIFYDDLERDSSRVASTLFERGYDNVYVLSGGLTSVHKHYPKGLITGTLPIQVLKSSPEPIRRNTRSSKTKSSVTRSSSSPSVAKLNSNKNRTTDSGKEISLRRESLNENAQLKENFTSDDLELLRDKLTTNLLPKMKKNTLGKATVASKAQTSREMKSNNPKSKSIGKPWVYNGPV